MKVAVSAGESGLHSLVEPRFGKNPYFMVVDLEDLDFKFISNTKRGLPIEASLLSVPLLAKHGVEVVLTGSCPPHALCMLGVAGIEVFVGACGTVREAVEAFRLGRLARARPIGRLPAGREGYRSAFWSALLCRA